MPRSAEKAMIRSAACRLDIPGFPTAWQELARPVKPPPARSVHSPRGWCQANQASTVCRCTSRAGIRRGSGPPAAAGARRAAMIMDLSMTWDAESTVLRRTVVASRASIQPMTSVASPPGNQYLTTHRSSGSAPASGSGLCSATRPAFPRWTFVRNASERRDTRR
jgi:hypothetical protein